ncbi:TRAP transporter small permease [Caenimonas soli]|uniref:TRAP transporter small permease n=1 Tax=Caenimonas soli TaxID=2735555 RepID=UPI001553D875|nr:TRAP transporter small permease [Caenimonas soli]NPC56952.1 TRAP transporter small permease [Caenimonas soli]
MRKILDRTYDGSLFLAGVFLVAIFAVMIIESILRKLGGYIPGASELIGWFCAAAGFLALPATFKRGDMVRVGVLIDTLPDRARKPILLGCLALAIVFSAYMLWAVGSYLWDGYRSEETTQGMIEIAVWIPPLSFLLGVILLSVAIIDEVVQAIRTPAALLMAEKPMSVEDVTMH